MAFFTFSRVVCNPRFGSYLGLLSSYWALCGFGPAVVEFAPVLAVTALLGRDLWFQTNLEAWDSIG